jgi:chromosome segregation ATPase
MNPITDKDDSSTRAIDDTTSMIKIDQLDRSLGHLISTARLGWGFFAFFLAIAGILSSLVFSSLNRLSSSIDDVRTTTAATNSAISYLDSRVSLLQAALGDAPAKMQQTSADLQGLASRIDATATRLQSSQMQMAAFSSAANEMKQLLDENVQWRRDIEAIKSGVDALQTQLLSAPPK